MARFKNHLFVVIGFAVAGVIGAAFGTGTAQAVVASLVQIANTTSSPVPTLNMTDPGRIAYETIVTPNCSGSACIFTFPLVPAGHRVVVQHIAGVVNYSPAPTIILVQTLRGLANIVVSGFYAPIAPNSSSFESPTLFYVDASTQATVTVYLFGNSSVFSSAGTVTLTGYELDCTVAACAPIATQ